MTFFRFGAFEADEQKFQLRRDGRVVQVQRIALETLFFLLRNEGRVVSKRELVNGPWNGLKISNSAVSRAVMLARRALEDESGNVIATVHSRGYRLVGPVRREEPGGHAFGLRQAELQAMHTAYAEARAGRGRVVVVTGSPGMGKTTLVENWARELARSGAFVVFGRAWQSAPELWPWLEIVRSCHEKAGTADAPAMSVGSNGEGLIASLASYGRAPAELTGDRAEACRLFDAVSRFLRDLARQKPLAIVLEDLHDADPTSVLLLEFLRRRIGDTQLLAVVTRRPGDTSEGAGTAFDDLGAHVLRLTLAGLSIDEISALAQEIGRPCSLATASRARAATRGNPRLAHELLTGELPLDCASSRTLTNAQSS